MCLIVDANAASAVFSPDPPKGYAGVGLAILTNQVGMVVGGRLKDELRRVDGSRNAMVQLVRAGKLLSVDDETVNQEESVVQAMAPKSDDPHVLALARVSGARLLVTSDAALKDDFKDRRFVSGPRGKVCTPGTRSPAKLLAGVKCRT